MGWDHSFTSTIHMSLERSFFSREKQSAINTIFVSQASTCKFFSVRTSFLALGRRKLVGSQEGVGSTEKEGSDYMVSKSLLLEREKVL